MILLLSEIAIIVPRKKINRFSSNWLDHRCDDLLHEQEKKLLENIVIKPKLT